MCDLFIVFIKITVYGKSGVESCGLRVGGKALFIKARLRGLNPKN